MFNNKFFTQNYTTRLERYEYFSRLISVNFTNIKNILNVGGGGERHLSKYLKEKNIFEIDISGDNDLEINLDKVDRLPFCNNQFDTVVCLDVLEHLENFHKILNEITRVSSRYIFISLPNCSSLFLPILLNKRRFKKKEGYFHKYYGLPIDYPHDRHRWFFTVQDIEYFFLDFAKKNNLIVNFLSHNRKKFFYRFLKFFFGERLIKELFLNSIWIILEKN